MKIEVLFVIDSLNCGGAEKSLVSLLPLLDKNKYDIDLWIRNRGGVFESLVPNNVNIIKEPEYSFIEKLSLALGKACYSFVFRFNSFFNKKEHHAETLWKCCGWAVKVPQKKYDIAVAYQQGFPTYLVADKVDSVKKLAWINCNIINAGYNLEFNLQFYDKLDIICPVSKELEKILDVAYPNYLKKYRCIYDILNPELIKTQAAESINEPEYNDKLCILTVGRLAPPKNHLLAVECARTLREKNLDFCWYFVGEGGQRSAIEALIEKYGLENNVKLMGLRTNPYPYMKNCDIYVQTSSFEGFGLTIAEAKILGKQIVSTNFDVVHDQLQDNINGLIADMNPESLADAIMKLATDSELRVRIVNAVESEVSDKHLTEVKKVEKIFDELLS